MMDVTVIEYRKPEGKLFDALFEEPEHAVRRYLEEARKEGCTDFRIRDYPNHWGSCFGDFVRSLSDEEPKPCPHCQSTNLEVDADGMSTSMKGIDYQNVWVECLDCGFKHMINTCDYECVDRISKLCIYQWNRIPSDIGNEVAC